MESIRKQVIKDVTFKRPYIFYFLFIFIGYFALNFYINQLYVAGFGIFSYNIKFLVPFLFFIVLVPGLVALNVNLVIHKVGELKHMGKKGSAGVGSVGILGVVGGVVGGACPGCFAGLFPAFIGLFGVTATLGNLPFYGLEIQAASSALLLVSIYYLTKPVTCKINFDKSL